jgi:integrase
MRADSDAAHAYFLRFHSSKDLFVVALETGIRSGDLRTLARRHIDFEEGWIRFVQHKAGKEVVIPMSDECRCSLARAIAGRDVGPDDPVFVTELGLPFSGTRMQWHFRIAKRLAGITRRFRIHDARHSFACALATAGVPLPFIGKVMGDSNPATTQRYARPDQIVLERVREALNRQR